MGHVVEKIDLSRLEKVLEKANKIYEKENKRLDNIVESPAFVFMASARWVLDILDPIIGLLPGIGDSISAMASAPSLYFAIFNAKSIRLTMAILYFTIVDWLVGLVPAVGDIIDFFYMSHRKTYRICVGFLENDPEVQKEIDKAITSLVVLLIILGALLYFAYELIMKIAEWCSSLI